MEERHLSLSEVAQIMDVSGRTVRRWIKSGKLKAYKPGRDYRVPESAISKMMEESEAYPKAHSPARRPDLEEPAGHFDGWAAAYAAVGRELLRGWEKRDQKWGHILRAFVNSLPEERRGEVPLSRILLNEYSDWIIDTGAVINAYIEGVLGKRAVGWDPGLDQVCDQMLRLWPRISTHGRALLRSVAGEDDPVVEQFREQLEAQGAPGFETRYREASSAQGQD